MIEEGKYWCGGVQLCHNMKFDDKIEVICKRFKPIFIEHGQGYAVIEYEYTHEAARVCRHLRTYTNHYEKWSVDNNGCRIVVIDRNWSPDDGDSSGNAKTKTNEGESNEPDNANYAG